MATKIKEHYFEFDGNKYFRDNSHRLVIGHYGKKKDPLGSKAELEPQNKVKREHLVGRVTKGKPVYIDWSQTTNTEFGVDITINAFGLNGKVLADYDYKKVVDANLKLYSLFIDEGPLQKMLNQDADGARNFLKDEGNDGRIISEVWVVMDAELTEHFSSSTAISVSEKNSDLNVTASGGKYGTQTITLSEGTTFAYLLHKVTKWNKDEIEDMKADYHA